MMVAPLLLFLAFTTIASAQPADALWRFNTQG
jgi:hypothetical protein